MICIRLILHKLFGNSEIQTENKLITESEVDHPDGRGISRRRWI